MLLRLGVCVGEKEEHVLQRAVEEEEQEQVEDPEEEEDDVLEQLAM